MTESKLFEVRPFFRQLQIGLFLLIGLFIGIALIAAFSDDLKRMLGGNSHKEVVIKTMQPWGDDSRPCQFFNGNPAIEGGARPIREGDHLEMHCETGMFVEGDWRYSYVGTVKLDDTSEREFHSKGKYFVPLLCTKNGKMFDCIKN